MALDDDADFIEVEENETKPVKPAKKAGNKREKPIVETPLTLPTMEVELPKTVETLIFDVRTDGDFLTCRVPLPEVATSCNHFDKEGYTFLGASDTPLGQILLIFKKIPAPIETPTN
jgi:hypothetical protein